MRVTCENHSIVKIFFISPYNVQYTQTSQKNDVTFCEGFAENGCDVELFYPAIERVDVAPDLLPDEILEGYGVQTSFKLTRLQIIVGKRGSMVDRFAPMLYPAEYAARLIWKAARIMRAEHSLKDVFFISRSSQGLLPITVAKKLLGVRTGAWIIPWAHEVKRDAKYKWLYRNSDGIIGTNSAITSDISSEYSIPKAKLAESLNPVSDYQLRTRFSRDEAREQLGLNVAQPLIVYTGKLAVGVAEVDYILEAARQLPQYRFLFTGGRDKAVSHFRQYCDDHGISNATFTGFISRYIDVRKYQFAADVLVSYYSPKDHDVRYNLPNKICEYMLTKNVIVTPDYPATRDILDEQNAFFVEPENPRALTEGLTYIINHPKRATQLAEKALQTVQELTYRKRAAFLVNFLNRVQS